MSDELHVTSAEKLEVETEEEIHKSSQKLLLQVKSQEITKGGSSVNDEQISNVHNNEPPGNLLPETEPNKTETSSKGEEVSEYEERKSIGLRWRSPGLLRRQVKGQITQEVEKLQISAEEEHFRKQKKSKYKKKRIIDPSVKLTPIVLTPAVAKNLKEEDWKRIRKPPKGLGKSIKKQKKKEDTEQTEDTYWQEEKSDDEKKLGSRASIAEDYSVEGKEDENLYYYYEGGEGDLSLKQSFYLHWKCVSEEEKKRLLRAEEDSISEKEHTKKLLTSAKDQNLSQKKTQRRFSGPRKKKKKKKIKLTRSMSLMLRKVLGIPSHLMVKPTTGSVKAVENIVYSRLNKRKPSQDQNRMINSSEGLIRTLYNKMQTLQPGPVFFRPMTPKEQILSLLKKGTYYHFKGQREEPYASSYGQQKNILIKLKKHDSSESSKSISYRDHESKKKVLMGNPFPKIAPSEALKKKKLERCSITDSSESLRSPSSCEILQQGKIKKDRKIDSSECVKQIIKKPKDASQRSETTISKCGKYQPLKATSETDTTRTLSDVGFTLLPDNRDIKKINKKEKEKLKKQKYEETVQKDNETVECKVLPYRPGEDKIKAITRQVN